MDLMKVVMELKTEILTTSSEWAPYKISKSSVLLFSAQVAYDRMTNELSDTTPQNFNYR